MCSTWPRRWQSPERAKTAPRVREDCQHCFENGAVLRGESTKGNWCMSSGTTCEKNPYEW